MVLTKRPFKSALVWACLAVLMSAPSGAVERPTLDIIKMVGFRLPKLFDDDRPGPYNRAYDALMSGFAGRVRLSMTSFERGRDAFFHGQYHCSFLASMRPDRYEAQHVEMNDFVFSDPYNVVSLKIYTRPGEKPITSLDQLAGKKLVGEMTATDNALSLKSLPGNTQMMAVLSTHKAFMMLESGQADAVVSFDIDAMRYAEEAGSIAFASDPDFALVRQDEVVACWRTNETEALIRHINGRIATLSASGELQRYFYGTEP